MKEYKKYDVWKLSMILIVEKRNWVSKSEVVSLLVKVGEVERKLGALIKVINKDLKARS
tara:strand:+ start:511 stop:687 length:177 start_codon:yes stop_codon:yes gene_type:complete